MFDVQSSMFILPSKHKPQPTRRRSSQVGHQVEISPLDVAIQEGGISTRGPRAIQMGGAHAGAAGGGDVVVLAAAHAVQEDGWVGDNLGSSDTIARSGSGGL